MRIASQRTEMVAPARLFGGHEGESSFSSCIVCSHATGKEVIEATACKRVTPCSDMSPETAYLEHTTMARSSKRIKLPYARSKPQQLMQLNDQPNFASLPLELRQMILLEALKLGIPHKHTHETLVATLRSLVKIGVA